MYIYTQLYRCPHCLSELLVWDFERGSIVCGGCGCVVDIIYDSSPNNNFSKLEACSKIIRYIPSITEIEKKRRDVEIAERRSMSIRVVKMLPDNVRKLCECGIKVAYKVSPSLIEGKCTRSRYAVGYIVSTLLMGRGVDVKEISKMFRISVSTSRRLVKSVATALHRLYLTCTSCTREARKTERHLAIPYENLNTY
ncbi:MAG: TFIIB-type zinc ribbon-containing protein [Ignisphaera sp.]